MIHPYLVFYGNCREALSFYEKVFGSAATMIQTYGDYVPEGTDTPPVHLEEWILHAEMEICGTICWFADEVKAVTTGTRLRLSATVPSAHQAGKIFAMLSEGGSIMLEPVETFYSMFHGAAVDRFGVEWNIIAEEAPVRN